MSIENKEFKSAADFFCEIEAELGEEKNGPDTSTDAKKLKSRGLAAAMEDVKKLVKPAILDSVELNPDQMTFIKIALKDAVNILDISGPAHPNNYLLGHSIATSILAIAAYLKNLAAIKAESFNSGRTRIRKKVAGVLGEKK